MILVSACLVGINCKYSGGNNFNQKIFDLVKEGEAIPICPEQLGGLKTPRKPVELKVIDGKRYAIDNEGNDVTENFERGAIEVLKLAKSLNINKAILQPRSLSCGVNKIYSGNFDNKLTDYELEQFPLFFDIANAMGMLQISHLNTLGESSEEDKFWYDESEKGLKFSDKEFWKDICVKEEKKIIFDCKEKRYV